MHGTSASRTDELLTAIVTTVFGAPLGSGNAIRATLVHRVIGGGA